MPTVTVTFDATPISTPANLPALPQGDFVLPLSLNSAPNTCFNNTAQSSAWSCNIAFDQAVALQLEITRNAPQLGRDGTYDVTLLTNFSSGGFPEDDDDLSTNSLMYGASAPLIQPAMNLELVNDTFDLDRGPAWFRMVPYNKTVVLAENAFSASTSSKQRRGDPDFGPTVGNFQRKGVAEAGDKPWICVWPGTFVEIFIYATQNSSYASQASATITTEPTSSTTSAGTTTGNSGTATATVSAGPGGAPGTEIIPTTDRLNAYPRAIKVKERRVNQSPRAYCYQVIVKSDGSTTAATDTAGNVVTVDIDEIEQSSGMDKRTNLFERGQDGDMSDCGCMWFSS